MKRSRGYTLVEVVVSLSIFGVFLAIAFALTADIRKWEKRLPVNFVRNPSVISVVARMRRDVLDAQVPPGRTSIYVNEHDGYTNGPQTLIFQTWTGTSAETVVWDLREAGVARRISYRVGVRSQWVSRGLPPDLKFALDAVSFSERPYGVRFLAKDGDGQLAIDQILQPRAHD